MTFAMVPIPSDFIEYKDTVNKLPPFLEWIVERVQNYYSNYQSVSPYEPETTKPPKPKPQKTTTTSTTTEIAVTEELTTPLSIVQENPNPDTQINLENTTTTTTTQNTTIDYILTKPFEQILTTESNEILTQPHTTIRTTTQKTKVGKPGEIIFNTEPNNVTNQTVVVGDRFGKPNKHTDLPKPGEFTELSRSPISLIEILAEDNVNENLSTFQNQETDKTKEMILGKLSVEEDKLTVGLNSLYSVGGTRPMTIEDHIINTLYSITQQKQESLSSTTPSSITSSTKLKSQQKRPIDESAIYFPSYQVKDEAPDLPYPRKLW